MPATHVLRLNRILLPVDLTEPSEAAIAQAHRWAQRFGAALDVLYVLEEDDSGDAQIITDAKDARTFKPCFAI